MYKNNKNIYKISKYKYAHAQKQSIHPQIQVNVKDKHILIQLMDLFACFWCSWYCFYASFDFAHALGQKQLKHDYVQEKHT